MRLIVGAALSRFPEPFEGAPNHQIQMLSSLFFRNKGAYAIGKVINGNVNVPFAIAILHASDGRLVIDAAIFDMVDLLSLFSFSRAYFMVDTPVPAAYVQFIHDMLPARPKFELYNMIGLQKMHRCDQGKALVSSIAASFAIAAIYVVVFGMVMSVIILSILGAIF